MDQCNKLSPQTCLFLSHHGILGQKWGKKNGPPYPLDDSDHSASERKAGWQKSLDKGQKKDDNKTASTSSTKSGGSSKKGLTDNQKRIIRNVAIGAAVTAAVLGTAYVARKHIYKVANDNISRNFDKILNIKFSKPTKLGVKFSEIPIDSLSDEDIIVKKGTATFQRIVASAGSKAQTLMNEQSNDLLYATYNEQDNNFYKSVFSIMLQKKGDRGEQYVSTMKNVNDIIMPSEKKRVNTYIDLVKNDPNFRGQMEEYLSKWYQRSIKLDANNAQKYYQNFVQKFGDRNFEARNIYVKRLIEMGYNAIVDDNDANYLGSAPIVTLNATNDMVVKGLKKLTHDEKMLAAFRLKDIDFT